MKGVSVANSASKLQPGNDVQLTTVRQCSLQAAYLQLQ